MGKFKVEKEDYTLKNVKTKKFHALCFRLNCPNTGTGNMN